MSGWGVIFDLDGVIADSSSFHERSWHLLADEAGWSLPQDFFRKTFGMRNANIIPLFLEPEASPARVETLSRRKEVLFRQLADGRVPLLPGAPELVRSLAAAGVPLAVGSSTERENILLVLRSGGLDHHFKTIVASEDICHGKPAPDVFLAAARDLGLPPERCVVIEDAQVGIDAAVAAGMPCLAVSTTHPPTSLSGHSRLCSTLQGVSPEDLKRLIDKAPCPNY